MKAISFLKVLPIIGLFSGTLLAQEFPKPEEKPDFQFISTLLFNGSLFFMNTFVPHSPGINPSITLLI